MSGYFSKHYSTVSKLYAQKVDKDIMSLLSDDWAKIEDVYVLSRRAAVSFSLHHEEASGSWHFCIDSAAPDENWIGKSRPFALAVSEVIEWLEKLTKPKQA